MLIFSKDKKKKLSASDIKSMARRGVVAERKDWSLEQRKFVDEIEAMAPGHCGLDRLLQIESSQMLFFKEELEMELAYKEKHPEKVAEQERVKAKQAAEIERRRTEAVAAVEAKRIAIEEAEEAERRKQKERNAQFKADQKKQEENARQASLDRKKTPLIHSPAERKQRSEENLNIVLEFLRHERYSNVHVLSLVLRMSVPGTRKVLNKLVRQGWLIRDEVDWLGLPGKMHLFGISENAKGHIGLFFPEQVLERTAVFSRKKTRPNSGKHVLNNQLARLFLQRVKNPLGQIDRRYTPERDMPGYGKKNTGWGKHGKYPDGVVENSHLADEYFGIDEGITVAIETENDSKGNRYPNLICRHIHNINRERYSCVIYYRHSRKAAAAIKERFHQIIEEQSVDKEEETYYKSRFIFDTYEDLSERIRALG